MLFEVSVQSEVPGGPAVPDASTSGADPSPASLWTVVTVTGDVDVASAPRLREQIVRLVSDGHHRLVIDLSGVGFLDSTGLGVLVGALKRIRTHEGELALVCADERVLRVFEITALDTVFDLHPTLDGALGEAALTMGEVVELEIPARTDFLDLARMVVTTAAAIEPTFADERISDLRLAVSEACTNAIEAHASVSADDRIIIRCDLGDDRIEVEIQDRGGGFDPTAVDDLPAASDPTRLDHERGLGISLMRTVTDETEFRAEPGGTAVRLVVYSSRGKPADPPPDDHAAAEA